MATISSIKAKVGKEEISDFTPPLPKKFLPTKDTIFSFPGAPLPVIPLPAIPSLSPNLEDERDETSNISSTDMEAEIFKYIAAQRAIRIEEGKQNLNEIKKKQLYRKELYQELNRLQKHLEENAKASEKLEWANTATTIGLVVLSVAGFISAVVSGGYNTALDALTVVGSTANSAVNITGQVMQLKTQEKEGLAKELQELRFLENELVEKILSQNQHAFKHLHHLWKLASEIIKNQNRLKLSS